MLKIYSAKKRILKISNSQQVFIAQIRALYRHTPMVLAVNVINSGLVALALVSYLEQTRWWIFFGLVTTLTAARAIGWKYYRKVQPLELSLPADIVKH